MNMFRAFMELDELNEAKSLKEYTYDDSYHKVKVVYENSKYVVEFHPDAPKKYWVLDKSAVNPLHAEETFYDEERAVDYADTLVSRLDEAYNDRQTLIDEIKKSGKNYNFDKYTDTQIYRIAQRLRQPKVVVKEPSHELDLDFNTSKPERCECGVRLTDFGACPVCDFGEKDLEEGIFDKPTMSSWVSASGKPVKVNNLSSSSQPTSQPNTTPTAAPATSTNKKYRVRIVSDKGRLRALGTDGTNPAAWVAFPNSLRQFEGQLYEVDQLIWNGKNYRVAGNIVEI